MVRDRRQEVEYAERGPLPEVLPALEPAAGPAVGLALGGAHAQAALPQPPAGADGGLVCSLTTDVWVHLRLAPHLSAAAFAKDENGKVLGGIRAIGFWNYCILELLWLSVETRGKGLGNKLMDAAENFAKEKGYQYIRAETLSFQAKPFYEKRGYKVFGELPDYPKGHTIYCLVREL